MPDTTTAPLNHDYDKDTGEMTPKSGAQRDGGNPGQNSNKSRFQLPQATEPKHADPKTGAQRSINNIIDDMS